MVRPSDVTESLSDILYKHAFRDPEGLMRLPEGAIYAVKLAQAPTLEIEDVVDFAVTNPPFSRRLFGSVNGANYRAETWIAKLRLAAICLGISECRILLMQHACMRILSTNRPGYNAILRKVFDRSVRAAQMARALADHFQVDPDTGYLSALMQDLGYARCVHTIADHRRAPPSEAAMVDAIEAVHCIAGAQLVHAWKLPVELAEVCLHHEATGRSKLAQLVHIANRIIAACDEDKALDDELTTSLAAFGFSAEQIDIVIEDASRDLRWAA